MEVPANPAADRARHHKKVILIPAVVGLLVGFFGFFCLSTQIHLAIDRVGGRAEGT